LVCVPASTIVEPVPAHGTIDSNPGSSCSIDRRGAGHLVQRVNEQHGKRESSATHQQDCVTAVRRDPLQRTRPPRTRANEIIRRRTERECRTAG
jgi:hypothetical protein